MADEIPPRPSGDPWDAPRPAAPPPATAAGAGSAPASPPPVWPPPPPASGAGTDAEPVTRSEPASPSEPVTQSGPAQESGPAQQSGPAQESEPVTRSEPSLADEPPATDQPAGASADAADVGVADPGPPGDTAQRPGEGQAAVTEGERPAEATAAAASDAAASAAPAKGRRNAILLAVAALALLLVLGSVVAVLLLRSTNSASGVNVGACLTGDSIDRTTADDQDVNLESVSCTDGDAKYKVVGRVEGKKQTEATDEVCNAFPDAEFLYWEGHKGKTGFVLCLAPNA
ncbi:MAG TPA: hypothetical protein VK453_10665 [Micromonosporaceae bacterium]|nr:hypothetical protein [Micromonosporaceae bacterium]